MHTLQKIVDVIGSKKILAIKHTRNTFDVKVKEHDISIEQKLELLCNEAGLTWDYKPAIISLKERGGGRKAQKGIFKCDMPCVEYFFEVQGDTDD